MYYDEENDFFTRRTTGRYTDLNIINSFNLFLLAVAFFKSKQEFAYRRHCHPVYEIIIPTAGEYKCLLNGKELSVMPGELLLVQEGDWHQDFFHAGTEFTAISFAVNNPEKTDYLNPANANVKQKLFKNDIATVNQKTAFLRDNESDTLLELLETKNANQSDSRNYYILDGVFHAFFWKVIALFPEEQLSQIFVKDMNNEAAKHLLLKIFEKNIHGKLDVPRIAAGMGMSRSQLTSKCKDIIGESPARAFIRYKLKRAKTYLKDSQFSIKQISEIMGFEDQFHFSKTFKRFYGCSPAEYRKKE